MVKVWRGQDLLASDIDGFSDPYCILKVKGQTLKTKNISNTLNPVWDEVLLLGGDSHQHMYLTQRDTIHIRVKDKDFLFDDDLGFVDVALEDVPDDEPTWYSLKSSSSKVKPQGRIFLSVSFFPAQFERKRFEPVSSPSPYQACDPSTGLSHFESANNRAILQVHILQARNLWSSSGLVDPYCSVSCKSQVLRTSTILRNLHPEWRQTLCFGTELGLLRREEDVLEVVVRDWDKCTKDEFLGAVSIPLWALHHTPEQPKWFGLKSRRHKQDLGEILLAFSFRPSPQEFKRPPPLSREARLLLDEMQEDQDLNPREEISSKALYQTYNGRKKYFAASVMVLKARRVDELPGKIKYLCSVKTRYEKPVFTGVSGVLQWNQMVHMCPVNDSGSKGVCQVRVSINFTSLLILFSFCHCVLSKFSCCQSLLFFSC